MANSPFAKKQNLKIEGDLTFTFVLFTDSTLPPSNLGGNFGLGAIIKNVANIAQTVPMEGVQIITNGQTIANVFSSERFLTEANTLSSIIAVEV